MGKYLVKTREVIYLDSEKVWEYLETGKNVDDLYPEEYKTEIKQQEYIKKVQDILLPNEKIHCYGVDNPKFSGYGITSFGRILNVKHSKQVCPSYSVWKPHFKWNIREISVFSDVEFNKLGWKHDIVDLVTYYEENKWGMHDINEQYYKEKQK